MTARKRAGRTRKLMDLEELIADVAEGQKLTGEQLRESDKEWARLRKEMHETNKRVGELTSRFGRISEDLLWPSGEAAVKRQGVRIVSINLRTKAVRGDQIVQESDILVLGYRGKPERLVCFLASVKAQVRPEHPDEFVEDLQGFHEAYPHLRDAEVLGIIAGIGIDPTVQKRAERLGLFVIRVGPRVARIANARDFKPRVWTRSG